MQGGYSRKRLLIIQGLKWMSFCLLIIYCALWLINNQTKNVARQPATTKVELEPESKDDSVNQSATAIDSIINSVDKESAENLITEEASEVLNTSDEHQFFCLDKDNNQELVPVTHACTRISNRLASISMADCMDANLRLSQCHAVSGFPILIREFAPLEDKIPKARVLVIGGTHGDELTSVSVVFKWIETLNRHHSGLFHWRVVPMMNPDGVLKKEASRTNQNGVDLNRNLPTDDWQENALKYWHQRKGGNPRRYPGEKAASEPETQWLIDEINSFNPDAIISVHAPYGMVDFDSLLLNNAPKSLGKLHLNMLGTYPGSLGNYAGINRNIPVVTLELPHAWVMPSNGEITKIWEDIVSWLLNNFSSKDAE